MMHPCFRSDHHFWFQVLNQMLDYAFAVAFSLYKRDIEFLININATGAKTYLVNIRRKANGEAISVRHMTPVTQKDLPLKSSPV